MRISHAVILACVAAPAAAQKTPRGFRKLENKSAELQFCYPIGWKQMPVQPTERVIRAKYMRPRAPRELRSLKKFYKGREPHLFVFCFDKSKKDAKSAKDEHHDFSIVDFLEKKSTLWDNERVAGKPGHYAVKYSLSDTSTGLDKVGYIATKEIGDTVVGVYGFTLAPYLDSLRKTVITMAGTVRVASDDNVIDKAARAKLDAIYEGTDYRDIPKRKKVRTRLPKGWKAVDTKNFIIVHNSRSGMLIRRIARDVEAMRALYEQVLPPPGPIDAVSVIRICRTAEDYFRYGGPPTSGGYFSRLSGELVLFDYAETISSMSAAKRKRLRRMTDRDTLLVMYHEALHQYTYHASGEQFPHDWFGEGLGDYFSGAVRPGLGGKSDRIGPSPWRIHLAKELCDTPSTFIPLKRILRAERSEFYGRRSGAYYALAWSFVYFLKKSPVARDNERWQRILPDYFGHLQREYQRELRKKGAKPSRRDKAVAEFNARKAAIEKTLDKLDLDALEAEWKRYVAALKVPASMRRK